MSCRTSGTWSSATCLSSDRGRRSPKSLSCTGHTARNISPQSPGLRACQNAPAETASRNVKRSTSTSSTFVSAAFDWTWPSFGVLSVAWCFAGMYFDRCCRERTTHANDHIDMRTLVLGGSGFLGSHIVDKFLREKHDVTVYDLYPERFRRSPAGIKFVTGDFGNVGALDELISTGFDAVIHCVSTTTPKSSNESPEFDIQSNVIGTLNLLDICARREK